MQTNKKKQKDTAENITISLSNAEIVERYGSAIKQFGVGYSGVDNEVGKTLTKSLKTISESKVHPNYQDANIKQQAGFSAEVLEVAKENAESIIEKRGRVASRSDDMGKVNDPLNDIIITDSQGKIIEASQMKFVGRDGEELADKLMSNKYDKYIDSNEVNTISVPKDHYDDALQALKNKEESFNKQAQKLKELGKMEEAEQKLKQAKKAKIAQEKLKPAKSTSKEARDARENPLLETAKYELEYTHKAGMQGAQIGAAIGGGISVITNVFAVFKGEKEIEDALIDTGIDTAKAATMGYGSAAAGSLIKGTLQNVSSESLRAVSKTNAPAMVVAVAIETSKTLMRYCKGEIDGVECAQELGEKGCGMLASSAFATLFQIALPVPVVGAMVGGMIGYNLSTMFYKNLLGVFVSAKLAREERIRIERECEEAIKAIRAYRTHLENLATAYLKEHKKAFNIALADMHEAMQIGDIDAFIESNNTIIRKIGKEVQFENFEVIDNFMNDDTTTLKL